MRWELEQTKETETVQEPRPRKGGRPRTTQPHLVFDAVVVPPGAERTLSPAPLETPYDNFSHINRFIVDSSHSNNTDNSL
jgi:hypothetical protein